jgi:hypothetical protein
MPGSTHAHVRCKSQRLRNVYLDSESTNIRDYIQRTAQNTVVIPGGIIFLDSCCISDSCDLCDACHNVKVPKVDDVSQATVEGALRPKKVKLKINEHMVIVAHCYSTQGPDVCRHLG